MNKLFKIVKNIFAVLGVILTPIFIYAMFSTGEVSCTSEELNTISNNVNLLKTEKLELENNINILKIDLSSLQTTSKTYPAGELYVGEDIPTGRFKIYDGSSNFIVRGTDGYSTVNIILDNNERYGSVSEYIYTFKNGETIEASSKFKLMPIE